MVISLADLKTEITADPKALGYAPLLAAGSDSGVAALLNSTYAAVGVVWRQALPASAILGSLVATEVVAWTQIQWLALTALISTGTVDASNANIRALFTTLLPPTSLANVSAAAKVVSPTRAAELWGEGAVVSIDQIAAARKL